MKTLRKSAGEEFEETKRLRGMNWKKIQEKLW